MTRTSHDIREIDLMAYADGQLERDPARKATVEAYLAAHPGEAQRVESIMRDNEAIRALYAGELERPVPARLLEALHAPPRRHAPMAALAAGLALAMVAGGGGWLAGQYGERTVSREFLRETARNHVERDETATFTGAAGAQSVNAALMSPPAKTVWIEIPVPDLSIQGYELTGRTRLQVDGQEMIRAAYRSPQKATVNLFMRLRGGGRAAAAESLRVEGLSVHHWTAGPLAYVLTVNAPDGEAERLAEMVRGAVQMGRFVDQPPANVAGESESVAGDGLLGGQAPQPEPAGPPPLGPNQFN